MTELVEKGRPLFPHDIIEIYSAYDGKRNIFKIIYQVRRIIPGKIVSYIRKLSE